MAQTIHIAILNTDVPAPSIRAHRANTYGDLFHALLSTAGGQVTPAVQVTSTQYDTLADEYPPEASLATTDLILITGSRHASFDAFPWIHKLEAYIVATYAAHPRVKWFGSCFGHQLLCQALLKGCGVRVEPDARGHEVGVQTMAMDAGFRAELAATGFHVPERLRMQFVHHDWVIVPDVKALPEGWGIIGSTEWCSNQGMMQTGRVLTYQGHFEFDRFVNSELIKTFFTDRSPEWRDEVLKAIDADDDSDLAARLVLHFAMQPSPSEQSATHVVGGLVTPPAEKV